LLDSFRKGQRWLTLIFVSVIGLVFVFFLGVGGSFGPSTPSGNSIIELDDIRLTSRDFAREKYNTENRLRQQLGDGYDQVGAERFVDGQAFGALLNSVILEAAATDLGLRVTQEELRRLVQTNPTFIDEEGRFSTAAFERFAEYEYGSQRAFIQTFTRGLLGQKLVSLLIGQTGLSDAELDLDTRYELEEIRLAYVALETTSLPPEESLEESEIETYAEEHEDELRTQFDVQSVYNSETGENLGEPERIRARHILFRIAADAPADEEASVRERASAALERITAGEDFVAIAVEVSEDTGTAQNGGDLGLFARGANDAAFDEAAFALEVGAISDVVRSGHGLHVIRVDEKIEAVTFSFETQRLALAREAATRAAALERATVIGEALAAAIRVGSSLEEAARAQGVDVTRTPSLKRRADGFVPGLGAGEDLLPTAFTLRAAESSPEIFELPDRHVLISVIDRTDPSAETLITERGTRRERARVAKQNRVLQAWINDYRSKLESAGRLRVNAELALGS
jgi:peptidyl-prolyl cis-trans isomerase D